MAQGRSVIAILLAVLLCIASLLSFLWTTGRAGPDFMAAIGLQSNPSSVMNAATLQFRANRGELTGIDFDALNAALALAPLEEEPFVYVAADNMSAGRLDEAEDLLLRAIRRNPRSRVGRALLIDVLARQGEARDAVVQIEALYRLEPDQRPMLMEMVASVASAPEMREATFAALTEKPLKLHVLRSLARNGASASELLEALALAGDLDLGDERGAFVTSLASPLADAGDWQGARELFTTFYPDAYTDGALILDPTFTGQFPPPFGWFLASNSEGYARSTAQGLAGEYYGRRRTVLARQTVILEPGDYQIGVEAPNAGRGLRLVVLCRGGGELGDQRIGEQLDMLRFSVPSDCQAVEIELEGRPADPPVTSPFLIEEVRFERTPL